MHDFERDQLQHCPEWRTVLDAYAAAQELARSADAEFDGWVPRVTGIDGIADADLPRLHGKLIAIGLLKFELSSRGSGMVYQLSQLGRRALDGGSPTAETEEAESPWLAESA